MNGRDYSIVITPDLARCLALACRMYRNTNQPRPDSFDRTEATFINVLSDAMTPSTPTIEPSVTVTITAVYEDHSHADADCEYLTRAEVQRLARVSERTIDRWLTSGQLRSSRHGRIRRIKRADLDHFLRANH